MRIQLLQMRGQGIEPFLHKLVIFLICLVDGCLGRLLYGVHTSRTATRTVQSFLRSLYGMVSCAIYLRLSYYDGWCAVTVLIPSEVDYEIWDITL
jgi:hypothetical protein